MGREHADGVVTVAEPGAGQADVLAGEPAGDDIDGGKVVGAAVAHVFELSGVWKSVGKDSLVGGVEFDLPSGAVACVFKAKVKASYACEQASNGGHPGVPGVGCSRHAGRRLGAFR